MLRFRLKGVGFGISYLALAFLTLSVFIGKNDYGLLVCLACALFHELSHIFLILRYCGKPDSVIINLTDVKINCDMNRLKTSQEVLINLAGPFANILLFCVLYLMNIIINLDALYIIAMSSLVIGVFNLLPLRTLDGGELLYILLSRFLSSRSVDIIFNIISIVILIPLAILGFTVLFASKYNYSLLLVTIYIILTLIL